MRIAPVCVVLLCFASCQFVATYQIAPWPLRLHFPMIAKGPEGPPSADAIAAAPTVHLCALSRKWHGKLVRLRGEVSPIIDTWDIVDADGLPCGVSFRLDPDIEQRTPETFEKFLNAPDDPPPTVSVVGRLGFHFTIYAIDSVD